MNLEVFEKMIKGRWMPHLIDSEYPDDLIRGILSRENKSFFDDLDESKVVLENGIILDITLKDKNDWKKGQLVKVVKDESSTNFQELKPQPPDNKGYCFYYIINYEMKKLREESENLLKRNMRPKDKYHFVHQNIQLIKTLAKQTEEYSLKYSNDNVSNCYVIDIFKDALIKFLEYYQEKFYWIPKIIIQTKSELLFDLFDERIEENKPSNSLIEKEKIFENYLNHEDKKLLINVLENLFSGAKNKKIAIMILALEKNGWIAIDSKAELFRAIRKQFGNIGGDGGINKFLPSTIKDGKRTTTIDDTIINDHANQIKQELTNIQSKKQLM